MTAHLISKRLLLPLLLVAFAGALALFPAAPASAASATKACTLTGSNLYTCTFTITPAVATGPGAWLVQMVPGPGAFSGTQTVASASGCVNTPAVTAGTLISSQFGTADYDVTVGSGGCSATATVVITETVAVTASGQICQRVWVTTAAPFASSCSTVVFTPPPPPTATPLAAKTCTLTMTPNRYVCLFTVTPGFPAMPGSPGDFLHINEPPGPPMTGPGTFPFAPTVGAVIGCAETPTPVVLSSPTSYNADIGPSGCPGTTWSVQFIETIDVTASGQICQSFYMVAAVPPATSCATVVFTPSPPTPTPSATKVCTLTATPNVYTCTFTITPAVAAVAGNAWLVQMVSPGPGTFTSPPPVVSASTTGCGSGSSLPSVTAGTLVTSQLGLADYNVTVGSAGCNATAAVVITETVTVTAAGQLCQTVWINVTSPGITACAPVFFTKSLPVPPAPGKGTFATLPNFGAGASAQAVFTGGTVDQLEAATLAAGGSGVWVQDSAGVFQLLIVNGPSFLKDAFAMKFPGGLGTVVGVTLTRPLAQ